MHLRIQRCYCRTRSFLVIPTKTSLLMLGRASLRGNRRYPLFRGGQSQPLGPLHRPALGQTASTSLFSSSFFFSPNEIQSVHFSGKMNYSIPFSVKRVSTFRSR